MKRSKVWRSIFVLAILLLLTGRLGLAQEPTAVENGIQAALGTGFTYQGRLTDNGSPANGVYDFRFILYDDPSAGSAVAPAIYADEKSVTGGLFTVTLNFGDVFGGQARYLGIGVRPGASGDVYQPLTPRQELTAAPYALYALDAGAHSH